MVQGKQVIGSGACAGITIRWCRFFGVMEFWDNLSLKTASGVDFTGWLLIFLSDF